MSLPPLDLLTVSPEIDNDGHGSQLPLPLHSLVSCPLACDVVEIPVSQESSFSCNDPWLLHMRVLKDQEYRSLSLLPILSAPALATSSFLVYHI